MRSPCRKLVLIPSLAALFLACGGDDAPQAADATDTSVQDVGVDTTTDPTDTAGPGPDTAAPDPDTGEPGEDTTAPQPPCDPEHVTFAGDAVHVRARSWSDRAGDTFTWFDDAALDDWILDGTPGEAESLDFAAALTAIARPLFAGGLPAFAPSPGLVPNFFGRAYVYFDHISPAVICDDETPCADGGACAPTGQCATACEVNDDCRLQGQRGFFGGHICRAGVCGTPNIGIATRVFGLADRWDGDASPGGVGDLDPVDVADRLALDTEPRDLELSCQSDADCPSRAVARSASRCVVDTCVQESHRDMFDHFEARHARRQAVLTALQDLADLHFGDDSRNLQCALDHAPADATITLEHAPGEGFVLARFVHAFDFEGTLRGQGMRRTTVRTLPGGLRTGGLPDKPGAGVLVFEGGSPTVSDLTFVADGTGNWGSHHLLHDSMSAIGFQGRQSEVDDPTEILEISSRVERVRFEAQVGPQFILGSNMIAAVSVFGEQIVELDRFGGFLFYYVKQSRGDHALIDCEVDGSFNGLGFIANNLDGSIRVEGNTSTFAPDGVSLVVLIDLDGSDVIIADNVTWDGGLLFVLDGDAATGNDLGPHDVHVAVPAQIQVENNLIHSLNAWYAAIELASRRHLLPGDVDTSRVIIERNLFHSWDNLPGPFFGAPFAFEGVFGQGFQGVEIRHNRFAGRGMAAVGVGLDGPHEDSGWIIEANDFVDFDAEVAHVHFGPMTRGNTVVSTDAHPATVMDQSGDNHLDIED